MMRRRSAHPEGVPTSSFSAYRSSTCFDSVLLLAPGVFREVAAVVLVEVVVQLVGLEGQPRQFAADARRLVREDVGGD